MHEHVQLIFMVEIHEKTREMEKKNVGMTIAQNKGRKEIGSTFVLYIQPTIPTYCTII